MRKIISILVALGLILGLSVMATPVSAAVTTPSVTLTTDCAGATANYTITFNITASLTQGVHSVCIKFPANTTVPTSFATGAIRIEGDQVFGTEVTVTGQEVCFLVPATYTTANNPIEVIVAGIKNPPTAGSYQLEVKTSRVPDSTYVKSAAYVIKPAVSVYDFVWDSSPTYEGLREGFIPPFKACGQNVTGAVEFETGKFANRFDLILKAVTVGCASPCTVNVTIRLRLAAAPTGANVSLGLNNTAAINNYLTLAAPNITVGDFPLGVNDTLTWNNLIHFNIVGSYRICLEGICTIPPTCADPGANNTIFDECFDITVYQWKDAFKLTLREKWNLISLPLVPLVKDQPIAAQLASIPSAGYANIESIWYYDAFAAAWKSWTPPTDPTDTLTTLEDGKAYWVRVKYPLSGCGNISWWVWGTEKPTPYSSPSQYAVRRGWNMLGFTSLSTTMNPDDYLWNWTPAPQPVVYGWQQGCWDLRASPTQGWELIPFTTGLLEPGQGYWVAFPADGFVYVP